ncbi:MAG: LysM peptidoglycan-binding domain-containing protein [Aeoliella sp.]
MSELTKMIAAAGLIAGGFFSATLFGVPEPTATHSSPADAAWSPQQLEPIDSARPLSAESTQLAWDADVAPAAHVDTQTADSSAVQTTRLEQLPSEGWQWPGRVVDRSPTKMTPLPEIRRAGVAPPATPNGADRFASLAPPPLLSASPPPVARSAPARFPEAPPLPTTDARSVDQAWTTPPPAVRDAPQAWTMSAPMPAVNAPPSAEITEATWHVVSDGDSLAKLASHYLQDESRADEIYELNRDQLANPDLLPIGAELRIPQRRAEVRRVEVFDSLGSATGDFREQRKMTRLPALPAHVTATPRARLQKPLTAKFAGG